MLDFNYSLAYKWQTPAALLARTGILTKHEVSMMADYIEPKIHKEVKRCSFGDCDRLFYGKGFCKLHWYRNYRGRLHKKYFRCDYSQNPSEPCWNAVCIPLSTNAHTIIDADDFDKIGQIVWHARKTGGASSSNPLYAYGKSGNVCLHRLIMGAPDGKVIDHKNHDTLDNRKSNLRICTPAENSMNTRPHKGKSYKGVIMRRDGWEACLIKKGRLIRLGVYETEEEAALAYNEGAKLHYGEFAFLNKVVSNDN